MRPARLHPATTRAAAALVFVGTICMKHECVSQKAKRPATDETKSRARPPRLTLTLTLTLTSESPVKRQHCHLVRLTTS